MSETALNIGALPELPADGLADDDLIEIERPQPGDTPNDNHRLPVARLRAGLAGSVGDVRLSLTAPGTDWVQQGAIVQQAEYPELFNIIGLTGQSAPPGEVWTEYTPTPAGVKNTYAGQGLWPLWMAGRTVLLVANGSSGTVWRSTDAGATWAAMPVPGSGRFSPPQRLDDGSVYVFREGASTLYRSTDTGLTWETIPLGHTFYSVLVLSAQRIVGLNTPNSGQSTWRISSDGGATFGAALSGSGIQKLRHAVCFDANTLFVTTGSAAAWHSADGGQSWEMVSGDYGSQVIHLSATEAINYSNSKILYTADAGQTWAWVYSSNTTNIAVVVHQGGGNLLVFHANNTAKRSADSGQTWEEVLNPPQLSNMLQASWCASLHIPDGPLLMLGGHASAPWYRSIGTYPYDAFSEFQIPQLVDVNAPLGAYVKGR